MSNDKNPNQQTRLKAYELANSNFPGGTPTELIIVEAEKIAQWAANGVDMDSVLGETIKRVSFIRTVRQDQEQAKEELRLRREHLVIVAEEESLVDDEKAAGEENSGLIPEPGDSLKESIETARAAVFADHAEASEGETATETIEETIVEIEDIQDGGEVKTDSHGHPYGDSDGGMVLAEEGSRPLSEIIEADDQPTTDKGFVVKEVGEPADEDWEPSDTYEVAFDDEDSGVKESADPGPTADDLADRGLDRVHDAPIQGSRPEAFTADEPSALSDAALEGLRGSEGD